MDSFSLSRSFVDKVRSPQEAVEQSLAQIKNNNSRYNAFITICEEEALEAARIAEEEITNGKFRGPLHGIPVAVKDVIFTEGIRTTMGSSIFENHVPEYSATVVEKLKEAGAIIVGKANTHEFAFGPTGDRSLIGPCRNPHNPNKITGGSSSGPAAAIAAGMVSFAVGTDTGGSIRIPASSCGIVGMKPTFGLVSTFGVYNTAYTLDHVGPMTKTIKENAILLNVLATYDLKDQHSIQSVKEDYTRFIGKDIAGIKIGLPSFFYKNIDKDVSDAMEKVIKVYEELGALIHEVEIEGIEEIATSQVVTIQAEAYAVHAKNMKTRGLNYDPELYERLLASKNVTASDYITAQQRKYEKINSFNAVFKDVDILLTPTLPILPTDIDQRQVIIGEQTEHVRSTILRLTAPTNYTGNPSLSVPYGFSKDGLPIGFQLIGLHRNEALLYQVGAAYEQHT